MRVHRNLGKQNKVRSPDAGSSAGAASAPESVAWASLLSARVAGVPPCCTSSLTHWAQSHVV